jgi:hypothetical protein
MLNNCFVYGTLMSPEVLQTLIGRVPTICKRAYLPNFSRHPVKGYVFPGIIAVKQTLNKLAPGDAIFREEQKAVEGLLLTGLSKEEMGVFDWFEGDEYTRSVMQVSIPSLTGSDTTSKDASEKYYVIDANVYVWCAGDEMLELDEAWNYDNFKSVHLESYLENTVGPCKNDC